MVAVRFTEEGMKKGDNSKHALRKKVRALHTDGTRERAFPEHRKTRGYTENSQTTKQKKRRGKKEGKRNKARYREDC